MPAPRLIVTCEHATNHIPQKFILLFADRPQVLDTHCACDLGALELARLLARRFTAPCFEATVSRLLVDFNRSVGHRRLFSPNLLDDERQSLLDSHYLPFRRAAHAAIAAEIALGNTVLHLSVHTFTPQLDGATRRADVALLYDPRRAQEKEFCRVWLHALKHQAPNLMLRRNYPYRGIADGFTTAMRKEFSSDQYLGIELEVNQKFIPAPGDQNWPWLKERIGDSLAVACDHAAVG